MDTTETWLPLPHDSKYHISSYGNLYSLKTKRVIKQREHKFGYPVVTLSHKGKVKTYTVHRLVAKVFIPNPLNYPEVCHIDNNPRNSKASNLRWDTKFNNDLDKIKYNTIPRGDKLPQTKLKEEQVKEIRRLYSTGKYTQKYLGIEYKIDPSVISDIVNMRIWKHIT